MRATPEQLCDALGACTQLNPVYRRLLKLALEELRLIDDQIGRLDREMASLLGEHQDAVQRLAEVPGLGVDSAQQIISAQPQKFSAIQTLLSMVGARIATYFPLRDGTAQVVQMPFTCQIWCALPAKSMYSKLCLKPAGLLATKSPLESAAQSMEVKPLQFFTMSSRVG